MREGRGVPIVVAMPAKPPLTLYPALALIAVGGIYGLVWALWPYSTNKLIYGLVLVATAVWFVTDLIRRRIQVYRVTVMIAGLFAFAGLVFLLKGSVSVGTPRLIYGILLLTALLGPKPVRQWFRPETVSES
jgi:thiol:disulfide interchange protein